jgi:uncharacterized protein
MKVLRQLADRTAVLFLGVAVGTAMGYAFAGDLREAISGDTPPPVQAAAPAAAGDVAVKAAPVVEPIAIECAMPFQPRLLGTIASGGKVRVGVFGDSFGDGVWAALYHQLPARENFQVIKYSQQSTGFTRYASLNLENHVAEQLAEGPIDVAVISFGANDTQGVMHNGHYAALLSPAWKEEIGARIERYIGLLKRQGAVVYWVGLPVMRKPSFDADISGMNRFFAEEMKRLDVPFIDTRPMSVDATGAYAAYLPAPGSDTPKLMRANDGIHMSMGGYQRLTVSLADRIKHYVGAAREHALKDGPLMASATPPSASELPKLSPPAKKAIPEPKPAVAEPVVLQMEPRIATPKLPEPAPEVFHPVTEETPPAQQRPTSTGPHS